jgi:hypothetical protein
VFLPSELSPQETVVVIVEFTWKRWAIEIKHIEKHIIIKDVDTLIWTVARGSCLLIS